MIIEAGGIMVNVDLLQHVKNKLGPEATNVVWDEDFFEVLLKEFNVETNQKKKLEALRLINQMLIVEPLYPKHEVDRIKYIWGRNSTNSDNHGWVESLCVDKKKAAENQERDLRNKPKKAFIDFILQSPNARLCLAECLLGVSSSEILKSDRKGLKGFKTLKTKELEATVAAAIVRGELSEKDIKKSAAYKVANSHVVYKILGVIGWRTKTALCLDNSANFFVNPEDSTRQVTKKILDVLAKQIDKLKDEAKDSWSFEPAKKKAQAKFEALTELKKAFTLDEKEEKVTATQDTIKNAFVVWKEKPETVNAMKMQRGFFSETWTQKFVKAAETVLNSREEPEDLNEAYAAEKGKSCFSRDA